MFLGLQSPWHLPEGPCPTCWLLSLCHVSVCCSGGSHISAVLYTMQSYVCSPTMSVFSCVII